MIHDVLGGYSPTVVVLAEGAAASVALPPHVGTRVVVGGATGADVAADVDDAILVSRVRELIATGMARNSAVAMVARAAGVARGRVYDAVAAASDR
jgi:uncharacterized protein YoaH (UPF0181 family)